MKRLLIFLHEGDFRGGALMSFLDLLPILTNRYNVYIVAPDLQQGYKEQCIKAGVCADNFYSRLSSFPRAVRIENRYTVKNNARRILYPFKVKKEIKKIHDYFKCQFDLVYSNSLAVQIGCEYAKYYKIPHIWHVREFMNEDHGLEFLMKKYTYNKLFAYSNAVFITNAISAKFNNFFKKDNTIMYDFVKFDYVEKVSVDNFVFAIVGRISKSKGQRYAIDAFNGVVKQYPNCKLLVVGQGDDMDYCKSIAIKYSIEEKVEFLGQRNDINKILSNVDVLLVCSRYEALGRVTIEGMLSKTLVIGADTAGTKELIGENYGLLYKQGDTQDLCEKMIYSIENKSESRKIVDNACKYANQEFSYDNYEKKLITYFERVLNYNEIKK